jgi:hypothetical protein
VLILLSSIEFKQSDATELCVLFSILLYSQLNSFKLLKVSKSWVVFS